MAKRLGHPVPPPELRDPEYRQCFYSSTIEAIDWKSFLQQIKIAIPSTLFPPPIRILLIMPMLFQNNTQDPKLNFF